MSSKVGIHVSCFSKQKKTQIQAHVSFGEVILIEYDPESDSESKLFELVETRAPQLEKMSQCEYMELGIKMCYIDFFDPYSRIACYKAFPNKNKYEIAVNGLQNETFFTLNDARFRIYEVLYHHLQQTNPADDTFDPVRQWIINQGLEFGYDSLIEQYLKSLKNLRDIQDSDYRCKICNGILNHFFVDILNHIPKVRTILPDQYRGMTLLFKSHEINAIRKSVDIWYASLGPKMIPIVSRTIIKSMIECVFYETCPCVIFRKWHQ